MPRKSQPVREDLKEYKETLRSHAKELRVLARRLGHDTKLMLEVEHAAECCEEARDMITLPKAPRKRVQPYTGGGTWHPAGMMPGGRRAPTRRDPESW